jgi:hypothetical protein
MFNRKTKKYVLVVLVMSSFGLLTTPAAAKDRKLPGVHYCTSNTYWTTNTGYSSESTMYGLRSVNTGGNWRHTACAIPSDSYFEHKDITQVNVHIGVVSNYVDARLCVHNPTNNDVDCGAYKVTSGTGEQTISFTGSDLDILIDYPYRNPFVEVTTYSDGNYIRGVYVSN